MKKERDPLTRDSRRSSDRLNQGPGKLRYHTEIVRGRWRWCGCLPEIRGIKPKYNKLVRRRQMYYRWAQ